MASLVLPQPATCRGISMYVPFGVDVEQVAGLARRGRRRPVNLIGTPIAGSAPRGCSSCVIAASTFARLGVSPALQTDAIASITTVVACQVGTPKAP